MPCISFGYYSHKRHLERKKKKRLKFCAVFFVHIVQEIQLVHKQLFFLPECLYPGLCRFENYLKAICNVDDFGNYAQMEVKYCGVNNTDREN